MKITPLDIPAIKLIEPARHKDGRGFFSEVWNTETLSEAGIDLEFVQDNHSLSAEAGTLRGMHFQSPPFAQTKLVRVVRGSLLDVVVDIRVGSPTYGQSVSVELSAANWRQLLVPVGFAHGWDRVGRRRLLQRGAEGRRSRLQRVAQSAAERVEERSLPKPHRCQCL